MSFSLDDENDQPVSQVDENQQGGTGLGTSGATNPNQADSSVSLGGGGSGVATPGGGNVGGSNQPQAAQAAKPSSSGSWTNLQSYLNANADQGAQIGNQIGQTVSSQAQSAQNDVSSAASDFTNNVNADTMTADPNAVNQDIQDASSLTSGSSLNPNDVTSFQNQANASYKGPNDFTQDSGYSQAQQDINSAQNEINETGSEAGRDVLLQNQYANASPTGYNQGEQNLDQLLLEDNPQNQSTLSGLQSQYSGLGQLLTNTTQSEDAQAAQAASTDTATAGAANAALSAANTNLQNNITNAATSAQTNDATAYNQALADLKSGSLTQQEMTNLGITNGEQYYITNPTDYLTQTPATGITPTNVATADEYAQAQALAQLAGQTSSAYLPGADASQAGTAPNPYTFNTAQFNNDVGSDAASMNNALNTFSMGPGGGENWQTFAQNAAMGSPGMPVSTPAQVIAALQQQMSVYTDPTSQAILGGWVNQIQNILGQYGANNQFALTQQAVSS